MAEDRTSVPTGSGPSVVPRHPRAAKGGHLPAELTTFVGRRRELADIKQLLTASRLVTLTGVGGVGKSRLARRVAAELRRAFPDDVWFVELAELRDPEVLVDTVATALRLQVQSARSPLAALSEHLANRQLLLVLDNCEQLLPACGALAEALLCASPELRILATSREPLGVMGEVICQIAPLPTPDPSRRSTIPALCRCASVALFLARARDAVPGFNLTEDNREAVAAICRRLDGLPLAIELAAARLRALTPQQIMERLTDRFTLLSRGSRQAPNRQQTLRASIDWSFELCSPQERKLWSRLAVFAGSFQLDAIEGICATDDLPAADLLNVTASLIDKSILIREHNGIGATYRLLETLRAYGQEKLHDAGGDESLLRRRHRDWYLRLAERAQAEWISDRQAYWLTRLVDERPNLRAAAERCLNEPGGAELALAMAVRMPRLFWWSQGLFGEGRRWLDRALGQTSRPTALRARALLLASQLAIAQGDVDKGTRLLEQGQELAQWLNASAEITYAAYVRGFGALLQNDIPVALESFDGALTILSTAPEPDLKEQLDVLLALATTAGLAGDEERAGACLKEMLEIIEPLEENYYRSGVMWSRGLLAWLQNDVHEATVQELESLQLKQTGALDDRLGIALCLEVLAWIAAGQHRARRAATLLGAAGAIWTDLGTSIAWFRHLAGYHDACERQVHEVLGEVTFRDAVHHGSSMSPEDTLAYARQDRRRQAPASRTAAPLTARERQVADLIAGGLSNKDIAKALFIGQRTAESHVEHILAKLGFASRAQVAAWVAEQRAELER